MFSSRTRGYHKSNSTTVEQDYPVAHPDMTNEQRSFRRSWAVLIQKVWEVDPLQCPKCGSGMKVLSIITDEIAKRKILQHLGLWKEHTEVRGPPEQIANEIQLIPDNDGWAEVEYV
jgi:hypothetical protein